MSGQHPTAVVHSKIDHRRRLPFIWAIPVVTLIIGAWLAWSTLSQRGPLITITFETAEGGLIYVVYNGIGDLGPEGYDNFLAGQMPKRLDLRTAPRMWTVHPDYLWVNRVQCVGVGAVTFSDNYVSYDLYALR